MVVSDREVADANGAGWVSPGHGVGVAVIKNTRKAELHLFDPARLRDGSRRGKVFEEYTNPMNHSRAAATAPLSADAIRSRLPHGAGAACVPAAIHVLQRVTSTNAWLRARPQAHAVVCLAEHQTAGRGRLGRSWYAPPHRNLLLSLGWDFAPPVATLAGLSLAVAVGLCRALQAVAVTGVAVKWPNDLVVADGDSECKLGGILIESERQGEACRAIIGVGLNLHLDPAPSAAQAGAWIDLVRMGHAGLDRNRLASFVIAELLQVCLSFAAGGFAPFREPWLALHAWAGRRVVAGAVCGTVLDVDAEGGLRITGEDGEVRTLRGGEISIGVPRHTGIPA